VRSFSLSLLVAAALGGTATAQPTTPPGEPPPPAAGPDASADESEGDEDDEAPAASEPSGEPRDEPTLGDEASGEGDEAELRADAAASARHEDDRLDARATSRARALHERGREALLGRRPARAVVLFRQALTLLPTVSTQYNLGLALVRTGEVTEAELILDSLLRWDLAPAQRARVESTLAEARGAIATLTVSADHDEGQAELEVDGFAVGTIPANDALRVQVDPGLHRVSAWSGLARARTEVEMPAGSERAIALRLVEGPLEDGKRPWAWALGVGLTVLAGVALGLGFGLRETPPEPIVDTFTGVVCLDSSGACPR